MKKFNVAMPFTGVAFREIEADSEEEAIKKFLEDTTMPFGALKCETDADVEQWEFTEKIVEGNTFCGVQNSVDISEA